jgi:arsenate reductase
MEYDVTETKINVLFLCTGNSCRSQMAEGFARYFKGNVIDAYAACLEAHGLGDFAVRVMKEIGIDISRQQSKRVDDLDTKHFDYVITVCGHADEHCPLFPGTTRVVHRGFDDPPKLAESLATEEEKLACYRRIRDEIRDYVETLPESLTEKP